VPERQLAAVVEYHTLERDEQQPDLLLRSTPNRWPFPPHARIVTALVVALDFTESAHADLAAIGRARLKRGRPRRTAGLAAASTAAPADAPVGAEGPDPSWRIRTETVEHSRRCLG